MIHGQKAFDQQVKHDLRTYDHIQNATTGQGDGYMTGRLLGYPNFKNNYRLVSCK